MKRSVTLSGHRTSISLEEPFWAALHDIASKTAKSKTELIAEIDNQRQPEENLSSALRVFILNYYRDRQMIEN